MEEEERGEEGFEEEVGNSIPRLPEGFNEEAELPDADPDGRRVERGCPGSTGVDPIPIRPLFIGRLNVVVPEAVVVVVELVVVVAAVVLPWLALFAPVFPLVFPPTLVPPPTPAPLGTDDVGFEEKEEVVEDG